VSDTYINRRIKNRTIVSPLSTSIKNGILTTDTNDSTSQLSNKFGLKEFYQNHQHSIGKKIFDQYERRSVEKATKRYMKTGKDKPKISSEYYKFAQYQKKEQE
jgi:hypothetical protein